ncbi:hypothetical protein AVEN_54624-1 [Araneus ventricosus]|uniref:Uncharacterized protein n=1 Tax=Araneus ventricosus TaxID=182803 RepID=A0A4Y2BNH4_ARAVE|nr:hypothetical protein AVEN_54624-1 [Araneus ventricosus]
MLFIALEGRCGLVVKSRLRRVPGSKLDSTEDPPCVWACCTLNHTEGWCGSLERGCRLWCRPHDLPVVQNYEVRPKTALVLLQSGTLI